MQVIKPISFSFKLFLILYFWIVLFDGRGTSFTIWSCLFHPYKTSFPLHYSTMSMLSLLAMFFLQLYLILLHLYLHNYNSSLGTLSTPNPLHYLSCHDRYGNQLLSFFYHIEISSTTLSSFFLQNLSPLHPLHEDSQVLKHHFLVLHAHPSQESFPKLPRFPRWLHFTCLLVSVLFTLLHLSLFVSSTLYPLFQQLISSLVSPIYFFWRHLLNITIYNTSN